MDVQGWHLFLKEITVEKDVKMHQARTRHTVETSAATAAGLHAFSHAMPHLVMQSAYPSDIRQRNISERLLSCIQSAPGCDILLCFSESFPIFPLTSHASAGTCFAAGPNGRAFRARN